MRRVFQGRGGMVLAFVLGLLIATAGTAGAARLITGKQIKDGSITSKDLSKALRKTLAATAKDGPQGPQGPKGDPGKDATAAAPTVVTVKEQTASFVSCLVEYDVLCGNRGANNYWTQASGGSFGPLRYSVDAAGYVQFEGTTQLVGPGGPNAGIVFYVVRDHQPPTTIRFPIVKITDAPAPSFPDAEPAYVRIGDNGEVWIIDPNGLADGNRYDLSSVRFRAASS